MTTVVYRVDAPPSGIEKTGNGSNPTDEQMAEETKTRQAFVDAVSPRLAALLDRPAQRSGNVSAIELIGGNSWSELNHYVLLVTVDTGDPGIAFDSFVPPGTLVEALGSFGPVAQWPDGDRS